MLFALRRLEREVADDEQRALLGEAREGVAAAIEDVRDLIADLRPKVLDDFGLGPALERLCETIAAAAGSQVRPELGDGLDALPPRVATATTGSCRRRSANVVRHAGARDGSVTPRPSSRRLHRHDRGRRLRVRAGHARLRHRGHDRASAHGGGTRRPREPEGGGARVRFETRAQAP